MTDKRLSELPQGLVPKIFYALDDGGFSKQFKSQKVLNVRDFNAKADGSDDTAAIQACFDAAFGPYDAPHGGSGSGNPTLNSAVYFPAGAYTVSSSWTQNILGTSDSGFVEPGTGYHSCVIQVASTLGLQTGDMVYVRGCLDPGANGSYGADVLDGTHILLKRAQFTGVFGAGGTVTKPCLRIHMVQGGHIFGDGRISTGIYSNSPNCAVLTLNGWGYSRIENLALGSAAGGIGLDYNWCQRDGDSASSQSNTFRNCFFSGSDYGLAIGLGQAMCSENLFEQCYISAFKTGVVVGNYNALQNTFILGNIAGCTEYGIYVASGGAPTIISVGFQNYADYHGPGSPAAIADIYVKNSAIDTYDVIGCRSESPNFFKCSPPGAYNLIGCGHVGGGFFYNGVGPANLIGNTSHGIIQGGGELYLRGNNFDNANYNQWGGFGGKEYALPFYKSVLADASINTLQSSGGAFDNAGAAGEVILTLPVNATFGISGPGSISGPTMTINSVDGGAFMAFGVGSVIHGAGVVLGTVITALGTGTGGAGTYTVSPPQTVAGPVSLGVVDERMPRGATIEFYIAVPQFLRIKGDTGNGVRIRIDAAETAPGGFIRSNVVGNSIKLRCIETGGFRWAAIARSGTWTIDS